MKNMEYFCDWCNGDLNTSKGITKFRLTLSCKHLPHGPDGFVIDVYVMSPINREYHFCGNKCLKNYVKEKF